MKKSEFFGQHLAVSRGIYTHHGLGDSKGNVIHYSGLANGLQSGPICRVSLAEFAGGRKIKIIRYPRRKYSKEEAVRRAESRLGENGYSIWGNNCEHFVMWCISGDHNSKQVNRVATAVVAGLTHGARRGALALVSAKGAVVGTSASGIMSGLATTGAVVGGGAVAGVAILGGLGSAGMASLLSNTVFKDDENLPNDERAARAAARKATYTGAACATAGGIAAISSAGATAGVSAAGITSGLSAIGGMVGAGMAGGVTIVTATPVAAAAAVGYGAYAVAKWLNSRRGRIRDSSDVDNSRL